MTRGHNSILTTAHGSVYRNWVTVTICNDRHKCGLSLHICLLNHARSITDGNGYYTTFGIGYTCWFDFLMGFPHGLMGKHKTFIENQLLHSSVSQSTLLVLHQIDRVERGLTELHDDKVFKSFQDKIAKL